MAWVQLMNNSVKKYSEQMNLVLRVSYLTAPQGGGKIRDPGNEVENKFMVYHGISHGMEAMSGFSLSILI